ncbi:uncharacterized protein LOC111879742 [Lactuca sativa]|uniref:uncharacterized protein LOC111879742 n=1 Tax=Lactuca sativa TaxID=4236 RepID=UPI000CD8EE2E|nr:uncharacterized protein LOC111879742 [Lactuca sativa]
MKSKYQGNVRVKKAQLQRLRREFKNLEMIEGESVTDYFGRVMSTANEMRNFGEEITDVMIVKKILRSLTKNFNYVVCSIEESKDTDAMSVDELQSSLLVHEQKLLKKPSDDQGDKLVNYTEFDEGEDLLLMTHAEVKKECKEGIWFLDSACSNHMTRTREWFVNLDEGFKHSVKLGNDLRLTIKGIGEVMFEAEGITQVISRVYYVPELTSNLLSIGQLQEKDLTVVIRRGVCKILHPQWGVITTSRMTRNRMLLVNARMKPIEGRCLKLEGDGNEQI